MERIANCIDECKIKYNDLINKSLLWNTIICEIRTFTVSYAYFRTKQIRNVERNIIERLEHLDSVISLGNTNFIKEYEQLKEE